MAAQAGKLPSVATGAVRFIQRGFHSIVFIEEVRAVVGRFQRGNVVVTLLAGKRGVDFVVTDQAVGHLREDAGGCDILGLLDAVVAAVRSPHRKEPERNDQTLRILGEVYDLAGLKRPVAIVRPADSDL